MSIVNADAYLAAHNLMGGGDVIHGAAWKVHKYIRKERTKTGKTRYIYPSKSSGTKKSPEQIAAEKRISVGYSENQYNKPVKLKKAANLFNIGVQMGARNIANKKLGSLINKTIEELNREKLKDHANLANIGTSFIDAAEKAKKNAGPSLSHSAKGSTWKEHKYIKRINGTYYYPASYKGGRHLESGEGTDEENEEYDLAAGSLSEEDLEALAKEVIRGNFGNGQERKDLLGENYQKIQDRVNEILLGKPSSGSSGVGEREIYTVPQKTVEKGNEAIEKATSSNKSLAESMVSFGTKMGYFAPNERGRKNASKIK